MHASFESGEPDRIRLIRVPLMVALAGLTAAAFIAGCAFSNRPSHKADPEALVSGTRSTLGASPTAGIAVARQFARVYAASAYLRRPRAIPRETPAVHLSVGALAARVPPGLRGLRPRLLGLRLRPAAGGRILATAWIGGGHRDRFSVGFTVSESRRGWFVTSFSAAD